MLELELALALFRGRLAEDVQLGPSLSARAVAVDTQLASAKEDLGEVLLRLGKAAAAVDLLHSLVAEEPLRERAWALLMRARYAVDDLGGALDTFARARQVLAETLGIEPGEELHRIHRAVLRRELAPLGRNGSVVTRAACPHQLPPAPAVVGRAAELTNLLRYVAAEGGVVGVHGPAGVGTSTLAIHAAHAVADRYPDGRLYVDLRARPPGDAALPLLLNGLGATVTDPEAAVAQYRTLLADRRMLLVLDNATDAAQIRPYLAPAPHCTVLVASCPMLATLDGARHLRLGEPDGAVCRALLAGYVDAARLRADPDAVAELIILCGHLPLALRVAAARLAAHPDWSVRELVDRLRDDTRRLDELEAGDLAVRASLRAPYDLLLAGTRPVDRLAAKVFRLLGSHPAIEARPAEVRPVELAGALPAPVAEVRFGCCDFCVCHYCCQDGTACSCLNCSCQLCG
jgi:hypothetical protein